MSTAQKMFSWIIQAAILAVLAPMAFGKLTANPDAVTLFTELGIEPTGRYIIGALEALACILILAPHTTVHGAVLIVGLMLGAIIAHLTTILGITPLFYLASLTLVLSLILIYIRRKELKCITRMLS